MGASDGLACLAEIRGLAEAQDGSLWVIACNHLYRSFAGGFELATKMDVVVDSFQGITNDGEDGVVIGIREGLLQASSKRDKQGRLQVRMLPLPEPLRGKRMHGVYRDGQTLWFGCDQWLWRLRADKLTRYGNEDGLPNGNWDAIRVTPSGDLWLRSAQLTCWRPHGQARFREISGLDSNFYYGYLALTGDGSVLVPTNDGLAILNAQGVQKVSDRQGLHTSLTSVAMEDREGSIWVGLIGEGLARWLGRNDWEGWTKENGLPSNLIWSILRARSDRALWVGTTGGVVRFPVKGEPRMWNWAQQVTGTVRWLGEAPDGGLWLIAKRGAGLARIEPQTGQVNFFGKAQGLPTQEPIRGSFDGEGRLWIATRAGLYVAQRPTRTAHFALVPGGPTGVWDVAHDKQGVLFATTTAQGLWRYAGGRWRSYGKKDGLLTESEYVIAIAPDGAVWLRHRYDGIVERVAFDGEKVVSVAEIKPEGVPTELTALHGFDSLGHYWQGTSHGLSMLADPAGYAAAGASKENAANAWRYFSIEDGLISNDCDGEAFWADDDGSVWVGTSGGLAHYLQHSDSALLTGQPKTEGGDTPVITSLQVSQRPRAARIEFSSLGFKTEGQARFGYSVDGGNWIDAKERAATLAALPPGAHRFRVRMRSWGRPWSSQIAEVRFRLEPFWWETWWAQAGLYLAVVGTAFGLLRLWMNMQTRRAGERARILQEKARAEAASHAKSVFLAHMSHEIRTPLHQIIGLTEDLAALNLPKNAGGIITQLQSSSSGLFDLLNGILDFSKIEAGKLEIERSPFNLHDCLHQSIALFSRAAAEKGIGLTLDGESAVPSHVVGDALRLRQVLICLISNAVKFTACGEVRVKAALMAEEGERSTVRFFVVDTGIGISEERLGRLFVPFTQGDASTSRKYGGTGLGLVISKSLVQLMGAGDLSVESQLGRGTSFQFSISFERATVAKESTKPVATGSTSLRILLAEDNKVNQRVMQSMLARMGYTADLANDGAEAIEAATRQTYDLILMDIQMPNVDGLDATRAIRGRLPRKLQPRIFAVTAHATADDRNECLSAGMDGYLTKPVNRELLGRTLAEVENALIPTAVHEMP
jgi:signal transduction histidine kinase/CheY-like chemotaxis protein/streptogramin lyase